MSARTTALVIAVVGVCCVAAIPVVTAASPPTTTAGPTTTALPTVSLGPPPTTAGPTTVPGPPPTTAAPVAGALFASLDDLVARWNELATTASLSGTDITLSRDDMILVVVDAPRDVFASWITDSAYLGGTVDPKTENGLLLDVVVDPAATAVTVDILTTMIDLVARDAYADVFVAFTDLLNAEPGAYRYVTAGEVDFVVSVLEPSAGASPLISVAAAPISDEAAAVDYAARTNEALPAALALI
jgi:hypothetical protein